MNAKSRREPGRDEHRPPSRGRADIERLPTASEVRVAATSPPELKGLPPDLWDDAVVTPTPKRAVSLRVDRDVH